MAYPMRSSASISAAPKSRDADRPRDCCVQRCTCYDCGAAARAGLALTALCGLMDPRPVLAARVLTTGLPSVMPSISPNTIAS